MKFVDETQLTLESGKGGPGCVSFRREKFVPRGGPDGGDGGRGGDVILRVNSQLNSLIDLYNKRKMSAKNGQPGMAQNKNGHDGDDLTIDVPAGTVISDENGVVVDLSEGEHVLLKGGRGGKGNAFFVNSVNQAPTHAQPGEAGQSLKIKLELKLIADVGLVGFPNAGKSTLISRISAAKPKIADYPFTTLTPNLGVVAYGDGHSFVVADIPGLIPGAHKGAGLGVQFLKHIERTKVFVHLVDVSGMSGRDPLEDYQQINHELEMYDKVVENRPGRVSLMERPQIVALNKVDSLTWEAVEEIKLKFIQNGISVIAISAVAGTGLPELVNLIGRQVFAKQSE